MGNCCNCDEQNDVSVMQSIADAIDHSNYPNLKVIISTIQAPLQINPYWYGLYHHVIAVSLYQSVPWIDKTFQLLKEHRQYLHSPVNTYRHNYVYLSKPEVSPCSVGWRDYLSGDPKVDKHLFYIGGTTPLTFALKCANWFPGPQSRRVIEHLNSFSMQIEGILSGPNII